MSERKPKFAGEAQAPPELKQDERLEATILGLKYPVQGQYGEQIEFQLQLQGGYKFRAWMRYYEKPKPKSSLYQLSAAFMGATDYWGYDTVDDFLRGLRNYGKVFVCVDGFREYQGLDYPKLKVVVDSMPTQGMVRPQARTTQKPRDKLSPIDYDRLSPETKAKIKAELNQ